MEERRPSRVKTKKLEKGNRLTGDLVQALNAKLSEGGGRTINTTWGREASLQHYRQLQAAGRGRVLGRGGEGSEMESKGGGYEEG